MKLSIILFIMSIVIGLVIQYKLTNPYIYCSHLKIKETLNGTFSQCIEGYKLLIRIGAK